jgi:glycosyltransferase involved in cell wall biosynthesis
VAQTWPNKVLVVVDSGPKPSPFLKKLQDERLRYVHVKMQDEAAVSIGTKRNTAAAAAGDEADLIAHFDDDDIYAPCYLETLEAARGDAEMVKLSAWFVLEMDAAATAGQRCYYFNGTRLLPTAIEPVAGKTAQTYG